MTSICVTYRKVEPDTTKKTLKVALRAIDDNNVGTFRVLNRNILPVTYKDKFYNDIKGYPERFKRLAYSGATVIGAVACRLENDPSSEEHKRLYLMVIGVLAAYRGLGVGSQLLEYVLDQASKYHHEVKSIYLHVQTSNEDAVTFYKKFGFEIVETIDDYYTRVEPRSAYKLERTNTTQPPPPEKDYKKKEAKGKKRH
jgi:ribosomal protein S18 acetylase RimI-like enzyme